MKRHYLQFCGFFLLVLTIFWGSSCDDELEGTVYRTSDVKMIDEYLEDPGNNLTDFLAIIDKADYRGMLHAYGTYTLFAPTNAAVEKYMQEEGKTISGLTKEEAMTIVGYHVVNDTIASSSFVDGRLPSRNIVRQYLTTRTREENGKVYIEIDRKARVLNKDISVGNGIVHTIDAMLSKSVKTVAQRIDELPDRFSFMKDLFKETNIYKTLGTVENKIYYGVFMQDNQTFIDDGIETREKLLAHLRTATPEVDKDADLIENFVSYHVTRDTTYKYVVDLMLASALPTVVKDQVLSFSMTKDVILINEFKVGQLNEDGVQVARLSEYTDLSCLNGVMHEVLGTLEIKKRMAYRVYWDLGEQPEMKALKGFRTAGTSVKFTNDQLSEVEIGGKGYITYGAGTVAISAKNEQYVYGDYVRMRMDTRSVNGLCPYVEFKMPLLVEGSYKVWLCWRRENATTFRTTFKQDGQEDQVLPTVIDLSPYMPIVWADQAKNLADHAVMEQNGWKQYTARVCVNIMNSRLIGTIKVNSTGRHSLRLDALTSGSKGESSFDMIQFIPVDEDQTWPMIDMEGSMIEKGTPGTGIFPHTPYAWEN